MQATIDAAKQPSRKATEDQSSREVMPSPASIAPDGQRRWVDMIGHRGAFVLASCAAPLVPLVHTGIRSMSEPMKLFGPACVPIYIMIWAAVAAATHAVARMLACLVRSSRPQVGRSVCLSAFTGLLLGLAVTFFGRHWPWILAAVVLLGPVLFQTRHDATQLGAAPDERPQAGARG